MITTFSSRLQVHHSGFGRRVDDRNRSLIDFERDQITHRSLGFPRDVLRQLQVSGLGSSIDDLKALISPRCEGGALLIRPVAFSKANAANCGAMALQRFRVREEPAANRARWFLEAGSLLFGEADWRRHGPGIARVIAPSFEPKPTRSDLDPRDALSLPELAFDLNPSPSPRLRECAPASFAVLDALAQGRRAVFGLETFGNELGFMRVCAGTIALLPQALQMSVSIAAGFKTPVPEALIQWVDAHVSPPQPAELSAAFARLPGATNARDASSRIFDTAGADDAAPTSDTRDDKFQSRARRRVASLLGAAVASSAPGPSLLSSLRGGEPRAFGNPAAVVDCIIGIDDALAVAKSLARKSGWTAELEKAARAAVADLRRCAIRKPGDDVKANADFLCAIADSSQILRILATLIAADDRQVRRGIEQALTATAFLSSDFEGARSGIVRQVLNAETAMMRTPARIEGCAAVLAPAHCRPPKPANDSPIVLTGTSRSVPLPRHGQSPARSGVSAGRTA